MQLAKNLAELNRTAEAVAMLRRIVSAHPAHREAASLLKALEHPATAVQAAAGPRVVGRNDPCPCGSGKRYKLCHGVPA